MNHIRNQLAEEGEIPFSAAAVTVRLILDFMAPELLRRIDALHRSVRFSNVPVTATLRDVVHEATTLFRQPPLSASLSNDNPLIVLQPRHRGSVYSSYRLPDRRRWSAVSVASLRDTNVLEALVRRSELSRNGVAIGATPNSYYLHLGRHASVAICFSYLLATICIAPRESSLRTTVSVAPVRPESADHLCSGVRLLQGIAVDDYDILERQGGADAFRSNWACMYMSCPPWEAEPTGTACETPDPQPSAAVQNGDMQVSLS
jgi:hypothetical protein